MPERGQPRSNNEMKHHILPQPASYVLDESLDEGGHVPSPARDHLSSSSKLTECRCDDHMDWSPPSPVTLTSFSSGSSSSTPDDDTHVPAEGNVNLESFPPLPAFSSGCLTHAYQIAMDNRVPHDLLLPGGDLDPALYTPVFLHDILMLPGSLATVIGKDSPLEILDRLTPARLLAFTVLQHPTDPQTPCLTPMCSLASTRAATGMLILGSGRDAREAIKAHYRPFAKRIRHKVVVEVKVPVPQEERLITGEKWRLESRCVEAQVFAGRRVQLNSGAKWSLDEALCGAYDKESRDIEVVKGLGGYVIGDDDENSVNGDLGMEDLRLDGRVDWAGPIVWSENEIDHDSVEW